MKPNILNLILKLLFLISAGICAWLTIGPLLGMLAGKGPRGSEWSSWIGSVAASGALTLFLYVVWQSIGTLIRLETQQERMARAIETLSRRVEELSDKTHPA